MLTIATINVQNKYKLKKYDGIYQKEDHVSLLLQLLCKYHIDIVGLQEVNPRYYNRLQHQLTSPYKIFGKSRYPQNIFLNHIPYLHTFNEAVPIVTNHKVLYQNTKLLPFLSSYIPRIVTITHIYMKEFGGVTVFNTHLDNRKSKTKKKELQRLVQLIKQVSGYVILMGDFNMTLKNDDFKEFIQEMMKMHIYHVELLEKTFKEAKSNYAIDHIFLSDCFKVERIFLEKDRKYQSFSDHYPVICKISFSK